jgi:hypothetical protein
MLIDSCPICRLGHQIILIRNRHRDLAASLGPPRAGKLGAREAEDAVNVTIRTVLE